MKKQSKEYTVHSENELTMVARDIISSNYSKLILLKGNLGTGKTTFTKIFCELLMSNEQISSPTFSIVNEYTSPKASIYHFDLYRLESIDEALEIGIEEYLHSGAYCLIEWPEIIKPLIHDTFIEVKIESLSEKSRRIKVSYE